LQSLAITDNPPDRQIQQLPLVLTQTGEDFAAKPFGDPLRGPKGFPALLGDLYGMRSPVLWIRTALGQPQAFQIVDDENDGGFVEFKLLHKLLLVQRLIGSDATNVRKVA